ncbi:hypothetical protein PARHAE_02865 [Paracoccus haematequi]|uniref:Uncharacterized protein n=1 Tax=Paracoccus haematequi TaxID=2491866 RepID=A0A447IQB8_9RHOB|nr:hypothetical protein [Paracoccus haematequi]VDS09660.1 hypothetical protein PARHAE_02865 [Paracoccus haematequi]
MDNGTKAPTLGEQPNCDFQQAQAWYDTLGGGVFNWRFIHDKDKATPAIKRRGTLADIFQEANHWNAAGYGIFATVNEMDGTGYDANGRPIQGQSGDTLGSVGIHRELITAAAR